MLEERVSAIENSNRKHFEVMERQMEAISAAVAQIQALRAITVATLSNLSETERSDIRVAVINCLGGELADELSSQAVSLIMDAASEDEAFTKFPAMPVPH